MENDYIYELRRYFERLDTKVNWGIEPDEAVQIVLSSEERELGKDTLVEYTDMVSQCLEEAAFNRLGIKSNFDYQVFRRKELEKILALSPYAGRTLLSNYIDLSSASEVVLRDGRTIPINQGKK